MGLSRRATVSVGVLLALAGAIPGARGQAPSPTQAPSAIYTGPAPSRGQFAGAWDYNADDSVDVATGRPEQARTKKRSGLVAGPEGPASEPDGVGRRGAPVGGSGGTGGTGGTGGYPIPTAIVVSSAAARLVEEKIGPRPKFWEPFAPDELRPLFRDVLEVPESLTISLTPDAVTFRDDLDRTHTYFTNNKKKKYLMSEAEFHARTRWDGAQLKQDIEGARGFTMTQTYFLSQDGARLFVILRVGKPEKDVQVVGVNRAYDRVK